MSVTKLPREFGVVIICNGTTDDPHAAAEFKSCPTAERFQSATVSIESNRQWCATRGWGRGLRKSRKRGVDHCPSCFENEKAIAAKVKADRKAKQPTRDAAKIAKLKAAPAPSSPLPKKSRKSRSANPSHSPSADTAPAPAT